MVAKGHLYLSTNIFIDEVDQFFLNPGDVRHYGLLQEGDAYTAATPVGVESFAVSLFSSSPPEPHVEKDDDGETPARKKNRFFG